MARLFGGPLSGRTVRVSRSEKVIIQHFNGRRHRYRIDWPPEGEGEPVQVRANYIGSTGS